MRIVESEDIQESGLNSQNIIHTTQPSDRESSPTQSEVTHSSLADQITTTGSEDLDNNEEERADDRDTDSVSQRLVIDSILDTSQSEGVLSNDLLRGRYSVSTELGGKLDLDPSSTFRPIRSLTDSSLTPTITSSLPTFISSSSSVNTKTQTEEPTSLDESDGPKEYQNLSSELSSRLSICEYFEDVGTDSDQEQKSEKNSAVSTRDLIGTSSQQGGGQTMRLDSSDNFASLTHENYSGIQTQSQLGIGGIFEDGNTEEEGVLVERDFSTPIKGDESMLSTLPSHKGPSYLDHLSPLSRGSALSESTPIRPNHLSRVLISPDSDIVDDSRIFEEELCSPVAKRSRSIESSPSSGAVFIVRDGSGQGLDNTDDHQDTGLRTHPRSFSLWDHLKYEVYIGDDDERIPEFISSNHLRSERITNFLNVPTSIEKMIIFGFFICLDSFLSVLTILPIKFFFSLWKLIKSLLSRSIHRLRLFFGIEENRSRKALRLGVLNKIDLIQGSLIIMASVILHHITDASRMYHSVRGQDNIKLYVIFNVLEIADRLCCSFGQDILDSLFSPSTLGRRLDGSQPHFKPLSLFILTLVFTVAHTLVLFYQLVSLNVAINSYDHSLMTLLISNQFVEIKGSVFKKFEKENLFQMSCADIVERFQLSLMLTMIALRNIIELSGSPTFGSSSSSSHAYNFSYQYLPTSFNIFPSFSLLQTIFLPVLIVILSEILVDWLKHAFITKFNHIRPSVYGRFIDVLCKDLVGNEYYENQSDKDEKVKPFIDKSPAVSRRLGFSVIPICCLSIRVFFQALNMLSDVSNLDELSSQGLEEEEEPQIGYSTAFSTPSSIAPIVYLKKIFASINIFSNQINKENIDLSASALSSSSSILDSQGPEKDFIPSNRSDFSNFQLKALLILSGLIVIIFMVLFKLYLGICLRFYASERLKNLEPRRQEDLINGKGRSPIGSSVHEILKEKQELEFLRSTEFDVLNAHQARKRKTTTTTTTTTTTVTRVPKATIEEKKSQSGSKGDDGEEEEEEADEEVRKRVAVLSKRLNDDHQGNESKGRKNIPMEELSRFDMVRSRIW
ncbi:eukaryotic membrane protein family-domain-containing protein [Phakopsora pachyrhizi]|uniref:Eukaryotic membrane protein family-domain-containing protein n=1 Tax=Phakopsora pachyrhizi TaxID=170000 RepID=A0AAV0BKR8_PHAPC|nr:eukaryotic membrane protein family-domain-containing protein [Phakopsora pachyrhizi]